MRGQFFMSSRGQFRMSLDNRWVLARKPRPNRVRTGRAPIAGMIGDRDLASRTPARAVQRQDQSIAERKAPP